MDETFQKLSDYFRQQLISGLVPFQAMRKYDEAMKEGNLDLVRSMYEEECEDPEMETEILSINMHLAIICGHVHIVKYFLSKGANPNYEVAGRSALACAVIKPDPEVARVLIEHGANVNFTYSTCDFLSLAVASNKPELIELALNNGFDIDKIQSDGSSAISDSIGLARFDSLKFLLERGVDYRKLPQPVDGLQVPVRSQFPHALLACIISVYPRKSLEILLAHVERKEGKAGMIKYLNTRNRVGMTIMHRACMDQRLEAVQELVEFGADTQARDHRGRKPVDLVEGRDAKSERIRSILAGNNNNKQNNK